MNLLGFQSQVVTDAYRSMVRATWPSTLKVIVPGGLDAGLLREWRSRRPDGLLILRHYFPDEQLAPTKWAAILTAADQIADLHPILEVPINEASQTSEEAVRMLAGYSAQFVRLAADRGYKVAVGVFSEGNPSDLGWWGVFNPALKAARDHGGYLALHEYGVPSLGFEDWHLLRHRRVWATLPEDAKIPILITECGIDGGIEGRARAGWRAYYDARQYADWLRRYHAELAADPYVHGATLFLCGGNSDWALFDLGDEVDLRGPLTETRSMPARWTPQEVPTVPDVSLSVPVRVSHAAEGNYEAGPRARTMGVVIHTTRGGASTVENEYTATINWFENPDAQVSAHAIVGAGQFSEVCRSVHDDEIAYHAREDNRTHLSIEIAQATPTSPVSDFQYRAAAELCRKWAAKYGFPLVRVMTQTQPGLIGHEDTEAGKRDGKTDPGQMFDWARFMRLVTGGTPVPTPDPTPLRDATWAAADQLEKFGAQWRAAGYPQHAQLVEQASEAVKSGLAIGKGEK